MYQMLVAVTHTPSLSHTVIFAVPPGGPKPLAGARMKRLLPAVCASVFSVGDRVVGPDPRQRCPNRKKHQTAQSTSR